MTNVTWIRPFHLLAALACAVGSRNEATGTTGATHNVAQLAAE